MLCTSEEAILNEERSTEEEKMRILEGTFSFNYKGILVAHPEKDVLRWDRRKSI